jgi:hypothetical protein
VHHLARVPDQQHVGGGPINNDGEKMPPEAPEPRLKVAVPVASATGRKVRPVISTIGSTANITPPIGRV